MPEREAVWWTVLGVILGVAGFVLVRGHAPMLVEMWGVGLLIIGSVMGIVGLGVLLRIWR